jgi:signal transduction histidine kinase
LLPRPGTLRSSVGVELSGEPIGAIVYDSELIDDPELVRTAGRVVALGVDRERLTAALRLTEQSLRRSRERIVETADRERRRIAQDLHDGLQVQLVLLALEAQQLANELDSSAVTRIRATELRRGIDSAAAELRTLVHAVMPSSLVERGLAMATEDLMDRLPLPSSLHLGNIGSLPRTVESTAYFVVAEAVANVMKHAGASKVDVRLAKTAGTLNIEVVDNGVGGASIDRGTGIRGLLDRADVLGGSLRLDSPAGRGTNLQVQLPISQ